MDYTQLSKTVAHALRHEPWVYEIELDEEGWTDIKSLTEVLRNEKSEWENLSEKDLKIMLEKSEKKRYEIKDGKIRAFYGHSLMGKMKKDTAEPPEVLYHGTSKKAYEVIKEKGLIPMSRQYVHLSADKETAFLVGKRKDKNPLILIIKAKEGWDRGIKFYKDRDLVWLADYIPPKFIFTMEFN